MKNQSILLGGIALLVLVGAGIFVMFRNSGPSTASVGSLPSDMTVNSETSNAQKGGVQNASFTFTLLDVAKHDSAASCYTAIRGSVYDLTSFVSQHPGGPKILAVCGIDGTALFEAQHGGSPRQENMLATLKIGTLTQ